MPDYGLVPTSFDGTTFASLGADFNFVEDSQTLDTPAAQSVEASRPGRTPAHSFMQPDGTRHILEANITTIDQDTFDSLKGMFDPLIDTTHTLVVTDKNSVDRQCTCTIEKWAVRENLGNHFFAIALRNASGTWQSVTPGPATALEFNSNGDTNVLTNNGNTNAPLTLRLTPQAAIADTDGYSLARRIYLANQSEQPLTHFAAEGYAIEITGGGLDTAALDTANKVRTDLNDLRVWLNSRELYRWCSPATSNAATKVWCNIAMRPGKFATLAAAIDADDTVIAVDSIDGFQGWDRQGYLYIGNEPVIYSIADPDHDLVATITRLSGFGASHGAGSVITWIEHVLMLTYGWSAASAPPTGLDAKPVLDLAASSNVLHEWPGPFFNDADRRSMTFRRIVEGEGSPHVRGWDDGDAMLFEDALPEIGKPLADEVEVRFPVPAEGPLAWDLTIDPTMRLHGYAADLRGFESQQIEEMALLSAANPQSTTLEAVSTRLRFKAALAAIAGELDTASIFSGQSLARSTINLDVEDSAAVTDNITINLYEGIHFTLEKETTIRGFSFAFRNNSSPQGFSLWTGDANGRLGIEILGIGEVASSDDAIVTTLIGTDITLPAGEYWIVFNGESGISTRQASVVLRSKANIYMAKVGIPTEDVTWSGTPLTGFIYGLGTSNFGGEPLTVAPDNRNLQVGDVLDKIDFQTVQASITPIFAVLSVKDDPQSDAPTQTGNAVTVDNFSAPLEAARAPKITLDTEEDIFPIFGTLVNVTTGDEVALAHFCHITQTLELDFDAGEITDLETGLPANYAAEHSNPLRRFYLRKGANTLRTDIPGLSVTAVLEAEPTYWHTWV